MDQWFSIMLKMKRWWNSSYECELIYQVSSFFHVFLHLWKKVFHSSNISEHSVVVGLYLARASRQVVFLKFSWIFFSNISRHFSKFLTKLRFSTPLKNTWGFLLKLSSLSSCDDIFGFFSNCSYNFGHGETHISQNFFKDL